jgi:hypothetical protein
VKSCARRGPRSARSSEYAFLAAVGDAIVRKNLAPRRTVDADVCALDATGRVFDIKRRAHAVAGNLNLARSANTGRSIVDIDRLADSILPNKPSAQDCRERQTRRREKTYWPSARLAPSTVKNVSRT